MSETDLDSCTWDVFSCKYLVRLTIFHGGSIITLDKALLEQYAGMFDDVHEWEEGPGYGLC